MSEQNQKEYFLLVAGSRDMYRKDDKSHNKMMKDIVFDGIERVTNDLRVAFYNIHIVEGDANGADRYAGDFAKKYGFDLHVFPAKWNDVSGLEPSQIKYNSFGPYNPRAGYIRNEQMQDYIAGQEEKGVLCFCDGKSPGTKQNFSLAKKKGLPLIVYDYENDLWYQGEAAYALGEDESSSSQTGWTLPVPQNMNLYGFPQAPAMDSADVHTDSLPS